MRYRLFKLNNQIYYQASRVISLSAMQRQLCFYKGDLLPFLAFGYVVGQCQGQPFSGFNSSSKLALCHRNLIYGRKMVIFDDFW